MTGPAARAARAVPARRAATFTTAFEGAVRIAEEFAPADARTLRAIRDGMAQAAVPVVAVVGEVNQGKSSVVNALLGRPDLSPARFSVHTQTYLTFRSGAQEQAAVRLLGPDGIAADHGIPVPMAEVGRWAAQDDPPVAWIEVEVPAPWLGDLVLLDTPGAGGLDSRHGEIALAAAQQATALLFVTGADRPFSAPELDFLRRAAERVDLVVFALTRIGAVDGWSEVLEHNVRYLAEVAPRFAGATWIPVETTLATDAIEVLDGRYPAATTEVAGLDAPPDPDAAEAGELWEESGFAELSAHLQQAVHARAGELFQRNALRAARTALERVERTTEASLAALQADPQLTASLEKEEQRLRDLKSGQARWSTDLEQHLAHVRIDLRDQLTTAVTRMRATWLERAQQQRRTPSADQTERWAIELEAEMASVADETMQGARRRFQESAKVLFAELAPSEDLLAELSGLGARSAPAGPVLTTGRRPMTAQDVLDGMMGMSMGSAFAGSVGAGAAGLLGLTALTGGAALVLAAVGGVGGFALRRFARQDRAQAAELRTAITGWTNETQQMLGNQVERLTADARATIATAFRTTLDRLLEETTALIAVSRTAAAADQRQVALERDRLDKRRAKVAGACATIDDVVRALTSGAEAP